MSEPKRVIDFRDTVIRNLPLPPPGADRVEYRFRQRNGLTMRVYLPTLRHPDGRRVFNVVFRFGRKQERIRLAPDYPELGCSGATEQWKAILAKATLGSNSAAERRERRLANQKSVARPKTVNDVITEYTRDHLEQKSENHRKNTTHYFEAYIKPKLGKITLVDVARDMVRDLISEIIRDGKPVLAMRVQAALVALFAWCVKETGYLQTSPISGLKRRVDEKPRDRILSNDEIAAVLGGARRLPYPFGAYTLALVGLAQRRSEVAKMRAADINDGVWTIPAEDAKNDRAHRLILPDFALAVLDDARREVMHNIQRHCERTGRPVPEVAPSFDYLFGGRYKGAFEAFSLLKRKLDTAIEAYCVETGLAVPEPWRLHDLRRSAASYLARSMVPSATIGRLLNHTEQGVTAKHYIVHAYEREVGEALKLWTVHLAQLEARRQPAVRAA